MYIILLMHIIEILWHKIGANFFKSETKMTDLYREMIVPQFGNINVLVESVVNRNLFYNRFVILLLYLRKKLVYYLIIIN